MPRLGQQDVPLCTLTGPGQRVHYAWDHRISLIPYLVNPIIIESFVNLHIYIYKILRACRSICEKWNVSLFCEICLVRGLATVCMELFVDWYKAKRKNLNTVCYIKERERKQATESISHVKEICQATFSKLFVPGLLKKHPPYIFRQWEGRWALNQDTMAHL